MRLSLALGLAGVVLAGGRDQKPLAHTSPTPPKSQQLMSCERTYGPGWETCGDEMSSRFCYSPEQGQSCCAVDNGYCEKGTWCAPVAGYCCLDGEDLETCARNAGFELPGSESSSLPSLKRSARPSDGGEVVVVRTTQESVARRRDQWTLTGMGLGIGVVGIFMLSC
ncbi:hypothetical protein QBC40DRAFT_294700 [Triangularia verruculosa]|uniref:Uncharacterized protein n=1 Tax=Triangularia verruculosa TaxID=2587418 RepID=A0AAN7AXT5_9PEZI|nr:hypothetical protein QBC40DRAFT_294700 [Triangularia verruculosa]